MKSDLTEIRTLFLRYLKEETLEPLKQLARFVAFGVIGSLFVGFGLTMLLLGALRFLQDEFPVLDGSLSWLPYIIVVVLAALVIALTIWRIVAGAAKRRLKAAQ